MRTEIKMDKLACRTKAQPVKRQQFELAVVTRTGESGTRVILGVLHDEELLRTALERLVQTASRGAANAGNALSARASFAQMRVYREMLAAL